MDKPMTKEESYVERRKLFKNIWATAMHMDEKEADIMSKPKVIKTLRLDDVDRTNIGKRKKQKIKNLRNVCNRLLDFCDRQEADDVFYEQMAAEDREKLDQNLKEDETTSKKIKTTKMKKKVKKAKSYPPVRDNMHPKQATSEAIDARYPHECTKASKHTSPVRFRRPTVVKRATVVANKNLNPRASPERNFVLPPQSFPKEATSSRKVVKKKVSIKKKQSIHVEPAVKKKVN